MAVRVGATATVLLVAFHFSVDGVLGQQLRDDCECGVIPTSEKLEEDFRSSTSRTPWIAAVRVNKDFECGASLISDRYLLTAAHCVADLPIYETDVLLGVHDSVYTENSTVIGTIYRIIIHENYTEWKHYASHDIALIRLDQPVMFGSRINPVCLPNVSIGNGGMEGVFKHGQNAHIAGWGHVSQKGFYRAVLRDGQVTTMSKEQCITESKYSEKILGEDIFCAAAHGDDSCIIDSGGPMTIDVANSVPKTEQIGIRSFGVGCADESYPSVFINVSYYLDWILKNTLDAKYCRY